MARVLAFIANLFLCPAAVFAQMSHITTVVALLTLGAVAAHVAEAATGVARLVAGRASRSAAPGAAIGVARFAGAEPRDMTGLAALVALNVGGRSRARGDVGSGSRSSRSGRCGGRGSSSSSSSG